MVVTLAVFLLSVDMNTESIISPSMPFKYDKQKSAQVLLFCQREHYTFAPCVTPKENKQPF